MNILNIKKILLRLIFLFCLFSIFTQCTSNSTSSRVGRRLEREQYNPRLARWMSSKKYFTKYIEIDIDNNGLVDSIIYGRSLLVIALNYGNNRYKELKFIAYGSYDYNLDTTVKINNENILIVKTEISKYALEHEKKHKIPLRYNNRTKNGKYIKDSLTVKFGEIVSYKSNKSNKKHKIKEINFSYPQSYKIKIKSDKTLEYQSYRWSDNHGNGNFDEIKHLILPKIFYEKLVGLIQYADVSKLKDNYSVNATDGITGTLNVLYENGDYKEIKDYFLVGTINLQAIYKKMDEINRFFRN